MQTTRGKKTGQNCVSTIVGKSSFLQWSTLKQEVNIKIKCLSNFKRYIICNVLWETCGGDKNRGIKGWVYIYIKLSFVGI